MKLSKWNVQLEHEGLYTFVEFFLAYTYIVTLSVNFNCIVCLMVAYDRLLRELLAFCELGEASIKKNWYFSEKLRNSETPSPPLSNSEWPSFF